MDRQVLQVQVAMGLQGLQDQMARQAIKDHRGLQAQVPWDHRDLQVAKARRDRVALQARARTSATRMART